MYICLICEGLIFFFIPLGSASPCLFQLLELILSVWQTQHGNAFNPTSICINVGFTTWTSLTARWIFCPWAVSGRSRNEQHSWYKEVCLTKQQLLLRNEIPRPVLQAHWGLRFVFRSSAQTSFIRITLHATDFIPSDAPGIAVLCPVPPALLQVVWAAPWPLPFPKLQLTGLCFKSPSISFAQLIGHGPWALQGQLSVQCPRDGQTILTLEMLSQMPPLALEDHVKSF